MQTWIIDYRLQIKLSYNPIYWRTTCLAITHSIQYVFLLEFLISIFIKSVLTNSDI